MPAAVAVEHALHERVHVGRVVERLAHPHVGERLLEGVEPEIDDPRAGHALHADAGDSLELAARLGGTVVDQVHLVVAEGGGAGEGLGDGLVDDAPDLRRAAPVAVEGLDDQVIVLDQLDEPEGPGAHRAERQALVALLGGVLRRHDREVDEPVQQRRVGLAE